MEFARQTNWCYGVETEKRPTIRRIHDPGTERVISIASNQQPRAVPPMKLTIFDNLPGSKASQPPTLSKSRWVVEGRDLASKTPRRKTTLLRSRISSNGRLIKKRTTIGAPTDFRRMSPPESRRHSFRPLELSIYLPGNQLPDLPQFSDFELKLPPKAAWPQKSGSHHRRYSDTLSTFTVPRKPVGSKTRKSWIKDQGTVRGHRTTRSQSSASIMRLESQRAAIHNRSRSSPILIEHPQPAIVEERPLSPASDLTFSSLINSPTPSSPLSDAFRPSTPPPRADSLMHWLANPPSQESSLNTYPSHNKKTHHINTSTASSTTAITATSQRSHSISSSMTSATTLHHLSSFRSISEKNYELPIEVPDRKSSVARYEDIYPTIYEHGQYSYNRESPEGPRIYNTADIGVAF